MVLVPDYCPSISDAHPSINPHGQKDGPETGYKPTIDFCRGVGFEDKSCATCESSNNHPHNQVKLKIHLQVKCKEPDQGREPAGTHHMNGDLKFQGYQKGKHDG